ncbi:MAG: hypothetical protein AAFS12_05810, partial [Cyanobacteria bacterium J06632_19]
MRILNVAAYTVLAFSIPTIAFASEDNSKKQTNLQSKDLITKLKEAKKKSLKQDLTTINEPEFDTNSSI